MKGGLCTIIVSKGSIFVQVSILHKILLPNHVKQAHNSVSKSVHRNAVFEVKIWTTLIFRGRDKRGYIVGFKDDLSRW